jgi:hypothetical protein
LVKAAATSAIGDYDETLHFAIADMSDVAAIVFGAALSALRYGSESKIKTPRFVFRHPNFGVTWGTHMPSDAELIATVTYKHFSEVSVRYADGRNDTLYF